MVKFPLALKESLEQSVLEGDSVPSGCSSCGLTAADGGGVAIPDRTAMD